MKNKDLEQQIFSHYSKKVEESEANQVQKEKVLKLLKSWKGKGYPGIFHGYNPHFKEAIIITPSGALWSINEAGKIS